MSSATSTKPKQIRRFQRQINLPKSAKRKAKEQEVKRIAGKVVSRRLRNEQELKFHVVPGLSLGVDTTGTVTDLTNIPQGTTDEYRIGDKVYLRSLRLNYQIKAADSVNYMRVAVFQWTDNTTADPTPTDLLQNVATYPIISPWYHDRIQAGVIKVLYDKVHYLDSDDSEAIAFVKINRGLRRHVQYVGGGPQGVNKLYLFTISDSGVVSHPTITYYTKLQFTDK